MTVGELQAACAAHRPYASRQQAQRAADLHPTQAIFGCAKCDEGQPFEPYRCPFDPSHWHAAHNRLAVKEDTMHAPPTPRADLTVAPLRAGDTWIAVTARGKGQPVEIRRVSTSHVYFRATGKGADRSQTFKADLDAFRVRYAPLKLAEDRQRALAEAQRRGFAPPLTPPPVAVEDGPEATEQQASPPDDTQDAPGSPVQARTAVLEPETTPRAVHGHGRALSARPERAAAQERHVAESEWAGGPRALPALAVRRADRRDRAYVRRLGGAGQADRRSPNVRLGDRGTAARAEASARTPASRWSCARTRRDHRT